MEYAKYGILLITAAFGFWLAYSAVFNPAGKEEPTEKEKPATEEVKTPEKMMEKPPEKKKDDHAAGGHGHKKMGLFGFLGLVIVVWVIFGEPLMIGRWIQQTIASNPVRQRLNPETPSSETITVPAAPASVTVQGHPGFFLCKRSNDVSVKTLNSTTPSAGASYSNRGTAFSFSSTTGSAVEMPIYWVGLGQSC